MLVKLKRDLWVDGFFFKASRFGVEVPEYINSRPVVPASEAGKYSNAIPLPKDAEILSGEYSPPAVKKQEPVAISEIARKELKPKSFAEAMKPSDED